MHTCDSGDGWCAHCSQPIEQSYRSTGKHLKRALRNIPEFSKEQLDAAVAEAVRAERDDIAAWLKAKCPDLDLNAGGASHWDLLEHLGNTIAERSKP